MENNPLDQSPFSLLFLTGVCACVHVRMWGWGQIIDYSSHFSDN